MSTHRASGVRRHLWATLGVPFQLQTYRNALYLALAFPLGLAYFVFLAVGIPVGVGLAVTVVGVPIILLVLAAVTGLAAVEREIATLLLGVEFENGESSPADSLVERAKHLVTSLGTWKALVYLVSKFFLGTASFVIATTLLTTATSLLFVPFVYDQPGVYVGVVTDAPIRFHPSLYVAWRHLLVGIETVVHVGAWQVKTLPAALAVAGFGVLLGVFTLHLLNGLARFSAWYTKRMLDGGTPLR